MAFKLTVVKNCPVTRASQGRITMPPWVLAELAGTMQAERGLEWLVLLKGFRSPDGMEVRITGLEVPHDQVREAAHVHLPPRETGSWPEGEAHLVERVVGVLHSHNEMAPTFSGTDYATLNDRFETSVVISSQTRDEESVWLGFSYNAVGRVKLPCGAIGVVEFRMVPEGVEDWPVESHFGWCDKQDAPNLGDCAKVEATVATHYYNLVRGSCGLTYQNYQTVEKTFGEGAREIAAQLPPAKVSQWQGGWQGLVKSGEGFVVEDKRCLLEPAGAKVNEPRCDWCLLQTEELYLVSGMALCKQCQEEDAREWERFDSDREKGLVDVYEEVAWREREAELRERGGM